MSPSDSGEEDGPSADRQTDFLELAPVLFSDRFLESHVGRQILTDPIIALVELIANFWDDGATHVDITWPEEGNAPLLVRDNGTGMTDEQFERRWRTLNYDREAEQGTRVAFPASAR